MLLDDEPEIVELPQESDAEEGEQGSIEEAADADEVQVIDRQVS